MEDFFSEARPEYVFVAAGKSGGIQANVTRPAELMRHNLLVAALSAAAMPYVLPRMHDRYFFIADLLSLAVAFVYPRYWLAAVLFQIGSRNELAKRK